MDSKMLRKKNLHWLQHDYVYVDGRWRETRLLHIKLALCDTDRVNWISQHAISYRIRQVPAYDILGGHHHILVATVRFFPEVLTMWKLKFEC